LPGEMRPDDGCPATTGEPTLSCPTTAAILASVNSSFSGSGLGGAYSPPCVARA
jgi:hypothetical protein